MSWRFRRRLKILPGLWINLSKKGGSLSVGGHGLTANISKKGERETVGLPGTGISYQTKRIWCLASATGQRKRDASPLAPQASWHSSSVLPRCCGFWRTGIEGNETESQKD
jgi:hypothetical protein